MPQEMLFLAIFITFCIGMLVFGLWINAVLKEKGSALAELKVKNEQLSTDNLALNMQSAKLQAELNAQKEGNQQLKHDLEEQGKKLELKLNAIMEQHLEKKLQKLDDTSIKSLETLLKPFKENLDHFKKSVENSQENSTKKFAELSKEIELVAKAGMNISKEAENLTKAMKGKKQSPRQLG